MPSVMPLDAVLHCTGCGVGASEWWQSLKYEISVRDRVRVRVGARNVLRLSAFGYD